jgi:hypothetical protein
MSWGDERIIWVDRDTTEESVTMGQRFALLCALVLIAFTVYEAGVTLAMWLSPIG